MLCNFKLNDKPMSALTVGGLSVPAFSGQGSYANRRAFACLVGKGPLPPGEYYIFDRRIIGIRAHSMQVFTYQRGWFALHAIDDVIDDDETLCSSIMRGKFRLHPKGPLGTSEGCVTVDDSHDFLRIAQRLRAQERVAVRGSSFRAYGILAVA